MMYRIALVGMVVAAGLVPVLAQSGMLPSTTLMRDMGQATYRTLNQMVKGESPYDQAKVDQALAKLVEDAPKIAAAFPESSKGKQSPETRFSASPKVWDDKAAFQAGIAKLQKAVDETKGQVKNLDQLKAAYTKVNDACASCHETFRMRKS